MTAALSPGKLGGLKTRKVVTVKQHPSIMIYGGSGIGKSDLALSASLVPDMGPVLHINIENGLGEWHASRYPDVDSIDVDTFGGLQKVYDTLFKYRDETSATVGDGENNWRTVIVDNLTESQKQGMAHLFPESKGMKFDDVLTGSWGDGTWNKNSEQMRVLIRAFRSLPVYTIFVAWERDLDKSDSPKQELVPSFSPSFAKEAPGMLNDVFYYHFSRDGERVLETARSRTWTAKDRTGKLPAQIINPTMAEIHAYWIGEKIKTQAQAANNAGTNSLKPRRS